MSRRRSRRARPTLAAGVLALALPVLLAAGCSSTPDRTATGAGATQAVQPALATSAVGLAGSSWAVVEMGGSSAQSENFWQLFTRENATASWKLATPKGVADNGGLVVAGRGPGSLVTGFVPSQDLTFSPLATTSDNGASWSAGLVSGGLASLPGALAVASDGRLLAILRNGTVMLSAPGGTSWKQLADKRSLAATPAGRACGLVSLTGAAFGTSGQPLLAGLCSRPGVAGIFADSGGSWRPAGPALPVALAGEDIEVTALASTPAGEAALLAAGTGKDESLIAAWSSGRGARWTLAAPFRIGVSQLRSASFGRNGAIGIVLNAGLGATLAGSGSAWQSLPDLPARTATLVPGPGTQVEALANTSATLSVWRLGSGTAGWGRVQVIKVPVPFGSSS